MIFGIEYSQPKQVDSSGSTLSPNPLFPIRHVTIAAYPSSHNHGSGKWVPSASNMSFLTFRVIFHFHEQYGSDSKHHNSSVLKIFINNAAFPSFTNPELETGDSDRPSGQVKRVDPDDIGSCVFQKLVSMFKWMVGVTLG